MVMAGEPETFFSQHAADLGEELTIDAMPQDYIDLLDRFIDLIGGGKVLDAGCGWGKDVGYFIEHGLDAIGIDSAEGMIDYARDNQPGIYHRMDVRDLDFDDDSFDGIWSNTVMQFLPPPGMEQALDEFGRVLCPGGIMYITFKLGEGSMTREDEEIKRYMVPEAEAERMVADAEFTIIEMSVSEINGMEILGVFCRKD
jgi:SAM-dependent methyltransferase